MIDDQIHSIYSFQKYMEQGSSKKFNDDFIIVMFISITFHS